MPMINDALYHKINGGRDTNFWTNTWVGNAPLLSLLPDENLINNKKVKVVELWKETGGWNREALDLLPSNIASMIQL